MKRRLFTLLRGSLAAYRTEARSARDPTATAGPKAIAPCSKSAAGDGGTEMSGGADR
jgi:hypothetical protein